MRRASEEAPDDGIKTLDLNEQTNKQKTQRKMLGLESELDTIY
jgi:hypothetical protein